MRRDTPYSALLRYGPFTYRFTVKSGPFLPKILLPKPLDIDAIRPFGKDDFPSVHVRHCLIFRWKRALDEYGVEHEYEFERET